MKSVGFNIFSKGSVISKSLMSTVLGVYSKHTTPTKHPSSIMMLVGRGNFFVEAKIIIYGLCICIITRIFQKTDKPSKRLVNTT